MMQCPRCLGRVFRLHDHYGDVLSCLCCGWSQDIAADGGPLPPIEYSRESVHWAPTHRNAMREAQLTAWARRHAEGRR